MRTTLLRHAGLVPDRTPRNMRWKLEDTMQDMVKPSALYLEFSRSPMATRFRNRLIDHKELVTYRRRQHERKSRP